MQNFCLKMLVILAMAFSGNVIAEQGNLEIKDKIRALSKKMSEAELDGEYERSLN